MGRCFFALFLLLGFGLGTATSAMAADPAAGRKKAAATCAVCHGVDGLSKTPDAPNLAGNNAAYLIKQLKAFKSGARQQDQMSIIAKDLGDEDMANVAAWYSSLKVSVTMPQ
ncbi:MAG: cytochrome c [Rhodospirillaceae bacterium]|nr:MAG: cytochrome c [Rhodospirillaceae bacterium]